MPTGVDFSCVFFRHTEGSVLPDGQHAVDQFMQGMLNSAVQHIADTMLQGAATFGPDVLALKAHEGPQHVLQHCKQQQQTLSCTEG